MKNKAVRTRIKNVPLLFLLFINLNINAKPHRKGSEIATIFANSCWEMLLKVIGQPLAALKVYKKAVGKCQKVPE